MTITLEQITAKIKTEYEIFSEKERKISSKAKCEIRLENVKALLSGISELSNEDIQILFPPLEPRTEASIEHSETVLVDDSVNASKIALAQESTNGSAHASTNGSVKESVNGNGIEIVQDSIKVEATEKKMDMLSSLFSLMPSFLFDKSAEDASLKEEIRSPFDLFISQCTSPPVIDSLFETIRSLLAKKKITASSVCRLLQHDNVKSFISSAHLEKTADVLEKLFWILRSLMRQNIDFQDVLSIFQNDTFIISFWTQLSTVLAKKSNEQTMFSFLVFLERFFDSALEKNTGIKIIDAIWSNESVQSSLQERGYKLAYNYLEMLWFASADDFDLAAFEKLDWRVIQARTAPFKPFAKSETLVNLILDKVTFSVYSFQFEDKNPDDKEPNNKKHEFENKKNDFKKRIRLKISELGIIITCFCYGTTADKYINVLHLLSDQKFINEYFIIDVAHGVFKLNNGKLGSDLKEWLENEKQEREKRIDRTDLIKRNEALLLLFLEACSLQELIDLLAIKSRQESNLLTFWATYLSPLGIRAILTILTNKLKDPNITQKDRKTFAVSIAEAIHNKNIRNLNLSLTLADIVFKNERPILRIDYYKSLQVLFNLMQELIRFGASPEQFIDNFENQEFYKFISNEVKTLKCNDSVGSLLKLIQLQDSENAVPEKTFKELFAVMVEILHHLEDKKSDKFLKLIEYYMRLFPLFMNQDDVFANNLDFLYRLTLVLSQKEPLTILDQEKYFNQIQENLRNCPSNTLVSLLFTCLQKVSLDSGKQREFLLDWLIRLTLYVFQYGSEQVIRGYLVLCDNVFNKIDKQKYQAPGLKSLINFSINKNQLVMCCLANNKKIDISSKEELYQLYCTSKDENRQALSSRREKRYESPPSSKEEKNKTLISESIGTQQQPVTWAGGIFFNAAGDMEIPIGDVFLLEYDPENYLDEKEYEEVASNTKSPAPANNFKP